MYIWSHFLFPIVCGKSNVNPQSRDLVLQLVERILSGPKAQTILLNGAVRKGERIVPPAVLDLLMRATFPTSTARVKATERFETFYPTLKELARTGSGTKTTKQASQQLLPFAIQAIQENNSELTKEAMDLFIWCLTQNAECYKQWEKLYVENVGATIIVLRKLSTEWRNYSAKISPDTLKVTLKHLRAKVTSCSYCYLLSIPPMLRKYGFHLVLSGNRYYISDQGDFLEIDEQWQSRPRGGRKRKCPSIGSFCRKRIVSPEQASTLMYNVLRNIMQAEFCWWDEIE
ncbi:hypothetical protein ZIOFF_043142 [Zingiber officinale]|uniref:Uncharacterized protein n=1 Tax=Zingiber officinale TaxID=94328 RepID=A0A8J5KTU6_ZINOF|nr:hypothetical protein ZIOFF_043142 [Zingiber officinale]